jgi:hypothetical protein
MPTVVSPLDAPGMTPTSKATPEPSTRLNIFRESTGLSLFIGLSY